MKKLCTTCGYVGGSKRVTKGSFFIEIILWLAFLIPGAIYSVWRLTSRYDACPKCGGGNMIPLNSPVAKRMLQEQDSPSVPPPLQQAIFPPPPGRRVTELRYRIAKDGQDLGEYPLTMIRQMLQSGEITQQDYYFDHSANEWLEIGAL
jgi:hypothetical protein